jgi:hypothetical protein
VKEHDPAGKLTRAAIKKENARKAQCATERLSPDSDILLIPWENMENEMMKGRAESAVAAEEFEEDAELHNASVRSGTGARRNPVVIWDDSDE